MNPDCTCSTGKCNFHTHVLHGKLANLYRINPKFAHNYDSLYSINAKTKIKTIKKRAKSAKPPKRRARQRIVARDTSMLKMVSDRRQLPNPSKKMQSRATEAFKLVGISEIIIEQWLGVSCPCGQRREKLSRLGSWITLTLSGHISKEQAKIELDSMMGALL